MWDIKVFKYYTIIMDIKVVGIRTGVLDTYSDQKWVQDLAKGKWFGLLLLYEEPINI